jgi:hypothetical protein
MMGKHHPGMGQFMNGFGVSIWGMGILFFGKALPNDFIDLGIGAET